MPQKRTGSGVTAPIILNSAPDGGESASYPTCITPSPQEIPSGTHLLGGWVGSSHSECSMKTKISCPCQELNHDSLLVHLGSP
jgi:hypothetical protein